MTAVEPPPPGPQPYALLQMKEPASPEDVLLRARAGDTTAFDAIYARYGKPIRAHIWQLMRNNADADELTQDAFLKAWLALITGKYDERAKFEAWLYRVATRVCLDEIRHRRLVHFQPIDGVLDSLPPRHPRRALFVSVDPQDDPVEQAQRGETADEMRAAVRGIQHPNQRLALLLRYRGFSYDEIAEAMETTRAAVKSLLFRARECIRQSMPAGAFA